MSFNGNTMGRSRQARLARIARQATQTQYTLEEPLVAEEVLLADEIIPIEEVTSDPVEQPTLIEEVLLIEEDVPAPAEVVKPAPIVQQSLRSPQNILDSIVALLFQQHYQQIYQHMVDLENQIKMEQTTLAEKNKVDDSTKTE